VYPLRSVARVPRTVFRVVPLAVVTSSSVSKRMDQ